MRWNLIFISVSALTALAFYASSCSREPRFRTPKVGEHLSLEPVAVNYLLSNTPITHQAIKINAMWGGRALAADKGDPTLNFYGTNGQLKFSKKWAEYSDSYKTTDCTDQQIATLDGYLMGAALICDGSLDLSQISRIEAIDDKGERRASTSWGVYRISDDVSGVSIGFY